MSHSHRAMLFSDKIGPEGWHDSNPILCMDALEHAFGIYPPGGGGGAGNHHHDSL